jgi:hypothetical protein
LLYPHISYSCEKYRRSPFGEVHSSISTAMARSLNTVESYKTLNFKAMFEQMLGLVKDEVAKKVSGIAGISAAKQSAVVDTTASSLMSGLKKFATPDKLTSLLAGGGGNSMASSLSTGVVSSLTSKLGLSPVVSQTIAATVIPAVMSLFKKQMDDPSKPGFNLQSMMGALTSGASSGSGGGLGGMLGRLSTIFAGK